MSSLYYTLIFVFTFSASVGQVYLPIHAPDPQSLTLQLTSIGTFGLWRKARPDVPGHMHTGVDIKRPTKNYENEPILPIAAGRVISLRGDGPFAQIIIEHNLNGTVFWTLYEHIAGILVELNEEVFPKHPIARFMDRNELNRYGWQFDHFHFEVLKRPPVKVQPDHKHPFRRFGSFTLTCFTKEQLRERFYDPMEFFKKNFAYPRPTEH